MTENTRTTETTDELDTILTEAGLAGPEADKEWAAEMDAITTGWGEEIQCGVCGAAGIETPAIARARLTGGQVEDFCEECASQGPKDVWDRVEFLQGSIPAGSPWAKAASTED